MRRTRHEPLTLTAPIQTGSVLVGCELMKRMIAPSPCRWSASWPVTRCAGIPTVRPAQKDCADAYVRGGDVHISAVNHDVRFRRSG